MNPSPFARRLHLVHVLIATALVVFAGARTARAQETWAPVIMFDGATITINNNAATPIANGPIPNALYVFNGPTDPPPVPNPLISFPNGIVENPVTNEWIVADSYHSRLLRFATDHSGSDSSKWGAYLGSLTLPAGSIPYTPVVDDDGTILTPDALGTNTIYAFVLNGGTYNDYVAITSFQNGAAVDQFNQPNRLALIPDPTRGGMHIAQGIGTIVVLDTGNNRVLQLTPAGGIQDGTWTTARPQFGHSAVTSGPAAGNFYGPTGLAVDAAGNIYVTDPENSEFASVQVFDPNGNALQTISQGLSAPYSVAIDAVGRLFVTDSGSNRIAVFAKYDPQNPTTSLEPLDVHIGSANLPLGGVTAFPVPNPAGPMGTLQEPTALVFDQFGRLLVADTDDFRIEVFDKAGLNVTMLAYAPTAIPPPAYSSTIGANATFVTVRVSVSLPDGATNEVDNVVPAIPTASFQQGVNTTVVTAPPACVVMPTGNAGCVPLSNPLTGLPLMPGDPPLVYQFQFDRVLGPEVDGPVYFSASASGSLAGAPVASGVAQTSAIAVGGDHFNAPTIELATPLSGWYNTAPVIVNLQAALDSSGQSGVVQEIDFNFGPTAPDEGDFYTCFNYFTADDQTDTSCALPVYKEGITTVWYRALSTMGLYDHLTPSAIDSSVGVPGWSSVNVQLDDSAPTLSLTAVDPAHPTQAITATNGWYRVKPIEFDYTATDLGSLLSTVNVVAEGAAVSAVPSPSGQPVSKGTITFSQEGLYNISLTATDIAGNTNVGPYTIGIDTTAPSVTFASTSSPLVTIGGRQWSATPITATFNATDALSGFDANGTQSATCTVPVPQGLSQSVTCSIADYAGNVGSGTAGPFNIDSTGPLVTTATTYMDGTPATGAPVGGITYFKAPVTIVFTATDAGVGFSTVSPVATSTQTVTVSGAAQLVSQTFTDVLGNSTTVSLGTYAVDATAPVITVPTGVTATASTPPSNPTSAVVTFSVSATDSLGTPTTTCSPASDTTFAFGATTVTCTATDAVGNTATSSFTVKVQDQTPPVLTLPQNISLTVSAPQAVTFSVTATDNLDPRPKISCSPASGSVFQLTTTTVSCTATDASGNSSTGSFTVTLSGVSAPPMVTVPTNQTLEATGPGGTTYSYTASASDSSGSVAVSCTPASGSTFPLGTTTVTCKATNTAGTTTKTFMVKVLDTTAPKITQADITSIATASTGAIVTFTPVVSDAVDGTSDRVTCLPASGSRFAIGTTTVTCSATDRAGNKGTATFKVTVAHSAPVCTAAVANPKTINLSNHSLVTVSIDGVTTADGSAITYVINSIFQDEPTFGLGYGDVPVDGFGVGTSQAQVRAERSNSGNGRVYHIRYTATTAGGTCSGEVTTGVPIYPGGTAVDGGALYDSTIAGPEAIADTATTLKGVATTINVLSNDVSPLGYTLTVTSVSGASHGTTKVNANGTITYTPVAGYAGTDTFSYTVSDGHGSTDTATVTVTITAHFNGDGCDHDNHKSGHHSGDGDDHDKDCNQGHHDGDGCDHDLHRNGHYDGDGCAHDRSR